MGIDIYAEWGRHYGGGSHLQFTGFSIEHGHVGYLREAYHGEPYATRHLLPEAFGGDVGGALIAARTLQRRRQLPPAQLL